MATGAIAGIMNQQSINFLRWTALGVGLWWGWTRHYSLTRFVQLREVEQEKARNSLLVDEARVAYEAHYNKTQSLLAKKDGVAACDSDSIYFDAELWANWAVGQTDAQEAAAKIAAKK
ncbi:hypothetical protein BASA50_010436 [Batrachochytrium salamandrivorans]|uniref:ATP synthase F(0) complex subunit e, mitochondrial n=1 Tax=Batrachochytrium salamandrivorans TaxID=1357716 RepID=A0ABQ8EYH9_9FUNG|nr:hypothetical protein BASA60_010109 [Batrachochytrium salamandrivorans]KAH6573852.1 hypothetical protein BASA62_002721 [Batrachochytrium salamandrivorans]KAH6588867.1 hypothetical protein BASA50_010436 [Batrachochytrium salamandrivorans]KAH6601959.1 hypothetical protein BASA61_001601 [Batrachochytrium salamandrivorans]KAH9250748.1 hypothetical protein BASA81_011464 [Batrachochytrium salamandrivorans]